MYGMFKYPNKWLWKYKGTAISNIVWFVSCLKSGGSHSPGTTAGSTWDHQTASPRNSPGTPPGTLAYCDVSRTAAQPTAPTHRTGSDIRTTFKKGDGQAFLRRRRLTLSSSDNRLVMWSALRLILRGWLRCLNRKWSWRAPICRGEDTGQAVLAGNDIKSRPLIHVASCTCKLKTIMDSTTAK